MSSLIPPKFYFSHNYCRCLVQDLAQLLIYGDEQKVYSEILPISEPEEGKELSTLPKEKISDWMDTHGYKTQLNKMLLKTLYPALLADLYQFVTEALDCSEKGWLTISYALLRKPFRDNLFYLEWLLSEPEIFTNTFYKQDPEEFSLEKMLSESRVLEIVKQASNRTVKKDAVDPAVIYSIRYEKLINSGFDAMWNKALHLVTTRKAHRTEQKNINFIFTNEEDRFYQWRHIYSSLPILLDYTVDIAESLMFMITGNERPNYYGDFFHRELGFAVWSKEMIDWQENVELSAGFPDDLADLHIACPRCSRIIDFDQTFAQKLFLERKIRCPRCHKNIGIKDIVDKNGIGPKGYSRLSDVF